MVTILFGAGASFGSGSCTPYNPPLGNDLFHKLNEQGGNFSKLNEEVKSQFIDYGFEAGMASIEDDSRNITPMQKEMACYLSKFSVKNDNAYTRLFNRLRSELSKMTIVTLNYDLLIEQALSHHGLHIDYNATGQGVSLLKPHGSSNFLPQLPAGFNVSGNVFKGCGSYFEGLETKAVESHDEIIKWTKDLRNSDLSPVLALYQKGKRIVVNNELINNIQKKYVEAISNSNLIFVIGVKYVEHDNHIWDCISSCKGKVVIVDPYPSDTMKWAETNSLQNIEVMESGFEDIVLKIASDIKKHMRSI
ncbi:hypothetical protein [Psychromonas sp. Urea-02u-13]|uniref:hypothetical protein n=1 Tax=Psychromonas sp. Urea-02u-13 TaxID=2058326 RepID=UPI000C32CB5E|nr:hypothetical protein [Psychromonas sp. Urea-02u-13]PKG37485.1 hypothetical protein CXF74_18605 [Psychromonas sp. Urea-02u-13]